MTGPVPLHPVGAIGISGVSMPSLCHIPLALPGQLLCNGGAINSVSNGCRF